MKCMVCFQKEKEFEYVYKGVSVCSKGCYVHLEEIGISNLLIGKEDHLKRYSVYVKSLKIEIEGDGTYFGRTKKEINRTIREACKDISVIKEQIDLLKKHPDVRLQYLF